MLKKDKKKGLTYVWPGDGEHSDIMETIEKEIGKIAEYHDQLEVLENYFKE